jgi:hypothetical protein
LLLRFVKSFSNRSSYSFDFDEKRVSAHHVGKVYGWAWWQEAGERGDEFDWYGPRRLSGGTVGS